MEPTADEIRQALTDLGDTPTEVAATLAKGGHKGLKCRSLICPVAVYLHRRFPDTYVEVGGGTVVVEWEEVNLPTPVSDFILHFDAGDYAELVAATIAENDFLAAFARTFPTGEER